MTKISCFILELYCPLDQVIYLRLRSYLPGVGLFFVNYLIIAPILNQVKL